jgi:hypothetical protein
MDRSSDVKPSLRDEAVTASHHSSITKDISVESNEKASEHQDQFMSGPKLYILIFGLGIAIFLFALDMSIVVTAIPCAYGQGPRRISCCKVIAR